jgi:hypothetical protein
MDPTYLPRTLSEALGWLIEECAEVQAEVGKTIRFGLWSHDPRQERCEYNRDAILRELGDLERAISVAREHLSREKEPQP